MLNIHQEIKSKLDNFIKNGKIPNILFHGNSGTGKKTIINNFINMIYEDNKEMIKQHVMYVNCAHGKGIKFIREELKFFAKTNTNITINNTKFFKTIILSNADKLTNDAQSALRRCIELFTNTTRFFVIVEDKYKLLNPILSRLCDIYIPDLFIKDKRVNLYNYNLNLNSSNSNSSNSSSNIITNTFNFVNYDKNKNLWLQKELQKCNENSNWLSLIKLSSKLYEKGYSGNDLIQFIETLTEEYFQKKSKPITYKYELLLTINKVKSEIRNEKILMFFILHFLFLSLDYDLKNISFM